MPEFKSGPSNWDDKSPTGSKIAHFSLGRSGSHFCPFPDKDISSTFPDTLQKAGLRRSHKEPIQPPGQKSPFNTDAISPATYGTLDTDVVIISLEPLLADRGSTRLGYVRFMRRGNNKKTNTGMK